MINIQRLIDDAKCYETVTADPRLKLADGSPNPNHRKYLPFDSCAEVVKAYFQLFKQFNRNLRATWLHIEQHGPFFSEPEEVEHLTPEGFRTDMRVEYRSPHTGRLMSSETGLDKLLTNVVYLNIGPTRG